MLGLQLVDRGDGQGLLDFRRARIVRTLAQVALTFNGCDGGAVMDVSFNHGVR